MENKKEKIEIEYKKAIKIDSLRLSFLLLYVKETIIFSGVTIILYCNYKLTSMLTSVLYNLYLTNSKIESAVGSQVLANERYNSTHRRKIKELSISAELQMWQDDIRVNSYSIFFLIVLMPIILAIFYLLFTQLNLRSKFRISSTIISFLLVFALFINFEFNTLLSEGDGIIFIFNCVIPFIISFFLCLFVLLTPKNGKFSYYN